jgi:deazaflavin-dependent oxidoreductase (nitroreductase family)
MTRGVSRPPRPRGVAGRLLRAPLWFYHRNLGLLLGKRFLYLAHQGRLTGLRHETVLEVARLDHESGEIVVFAAWGNRADWVKNLRAGRALELRIGHLRLPEPEHRFLPDEERRAVLVSYQRAYPVTWWMLARWLGLPPDPKNDEIGDLRAVAFRPSGHIAAR